MTPPLWTLAILPILFYTFILFVKRYLARNHPPSDYEPTLWDRRYRLKPYLRKRAHAFATNLPIIRDRCYQPRIELHAHPRRHVIRYGLMPDGQWVDFGSTIDFNLEQAEAQYFRDLRNIYLVKWLKPLIIEGGEFSPLPPAWAPMLAWDCENARAVRKVGMAERAEGLQFWVNRAEESMEKGEQWMPKALFNARLKGRDWSQFISQPD